MSTKINVRSPFYLDYTEPVPTLGDFTCSIASLSNFSVSSAGVITVPTLLKGQIIDQTATSFPQNTSGSAISRSVTYTIEIPEGYDNVNDATIDCTVTADQPSQTAQEDPVQNSNCPTFSGSIPNSTGNSSQTVDLSTYFTAGASPISSYQINKTGDGAVSTSVVGNTLTVESAYECASASITVIAKNSADSCTATSNTFVFTTSCTNTFTCTDVALLGGSVAADGTISKAKYKLGTLNDIIYSGTSVLASLNIGANTTGSDRSVTLTYRFNVPSGYTNSGTIDCDITYTQPAEATLTAFDCSDAQITGVFMSITGSIAQPSSYNGTLVSWTPQYFPEVSTDTQRTITFTITAPSGYSNSGSNIECDVTVTQPARTEDCGTTVLHLSQGFASPSDFCTGIYATTVRVFSNAATFADIGSTLGQRICQKGTPYLGGNKYYAYTQNAVSSAAGYIGATFEVIQIDNFGIVQDIAVHNCSGGGAGSGGSK